jgi:hypothetical protein
VVYKGTTRDVGDDTHAAKTNGLRSALECA